jgi:hypothetical protein
MDNKRGGRVKEKKIPTSKYRGVHSNCYAGRWSWQAQISVKRETVYLGSYKDEKLAAKAYDKYVLRMGLNRRLNFSWKKLA